MRFTSRKGAMFFFKLAVGLPFLYAAVDGLAAPSDWVGYLPRFLSRIAPQGTFLPIFSIYEFVLAVWIVSGWRTRAAAILAALTYAGIVLANPGLFLVTFRDVGLLLAALGLAALPDFQRSD